MNFTFYRHEDSSILIQTMYDNHFIYPKNEQLYAPWATAKVQGLTMPTTHIHLDSAFDQQQVSTTRWLIIFIMPSTPLTVIF